jgi:hypothetical protein
MGANATARGKSGQRGDHRLWRVAAVGALSV